VRCWGDLIDRVAPHALPLPAAPTNVGVARRYFTSVTAAAGIPEEVRRAGALADSELVTNAVLHGGEPITLRVTPLSRAVRVAVSDGSSSMPTPRPSDRPRPLGRDRRSGDHGRGLAIVETVADRWGCSPAVQSSGTTVWCDLSVDRSAS
jgi:anti-sigma regulatory factor (Ser/Thr protein kinase)